MTIEPTEQFFMAGEVMVRRWEGEDTEGQPVVALVAMVMVAFGGQAEAEAAGLVSIPSPSPDDARRWAMAVMDQAKSPDDAY